MIASGTNIHQSSNEVEKRNKGYALQHLEKVHAVWSVLKSPDMKNMTTFNSEN